jgi:hypothetical protein
MLFASGEFKPQQLLSLNHREEPTERRRRTQEEATALRLSLRHNFNTGSILLEAILLQTNNSTYVPLKYVVDTNYLCLVELKIAVSW